MSLILIFQDQLICKRRFEIIQRFQILDGDGAAVFRIFEGIADQVDGDLFQYLPVEPYLFVFFGGNDVERNFFLNGQFAELFIYLIAGKE